MLIVVTMAMALAAVEPQDTVLIGDSQAQGLKNAGELSALGVAIHAFRGKPVAFFRHWLADHPQAVAGKSLILFQLGGNDITLGHDAAAIAQDLAALAELAHQHNPDAEIVMGLIPVRGQWFDAQQKRRPQFAERQEHTLNSVNDWIVRGRHSAFRSFAVNAVVADPDAPRLQRAEFRRHGQADVHLNRRGYRALSDALAASLFAAPGFSGLATSGLAANGF